MKRSLAVYLHRNLVGHLLQDEHGEMTFDYAQTWLESPARQPLSQSLPLVQKHFRRNECRGFFSGVLPEESNREIIAYNLGISARNDFALLDRIGGECAGAVTFMPQGVDLQQQVDNYQVLSSQQLAHILRTLPQRPLMAGNEGIRLSLAGAQSKVALRFSDGQFSVPLGGSSTTHILKPAIERFEGLVFNEYFCMQLGHAIGLPVARVEKKQVEEIDYLLVERYDRKLSATTADRETRLVRMHQEDFCQALGIVPENKYQNEGGPSLQQCFQLVREASSVPALDLQALLDAIIFNFLVGNHDAHGKNFSLLYNDEDDHRRITRLAPLYDVLSTIYYPQLSKKMAMKIGGEYSSDLIGPEHFEKLAKEAGLGSPLVKRRVPELADVILAKLLTTATDDPVSKGVADLIQERCQRTLAKFRK
jgi:serine/threonine-protein kinase HipA